MAEPGADGLRAEPVPPGAGPALLAEVLDALPDFWGDRDLRALHHPVWFRQLAGSALVVREDGVLLGYLLGTVTPDGAAYVHVVACRGRARGRGIGRLLHTAFAAAAARAGAWRVEAVTTPGNAGSLAFHRALGFSAELVPGYAGPGADRVLLRRELS